LEIKAMKQTYSTHIKIRTGYVRILVALLLLILLTQVLGDNQRPRPPRSRSGQIPEAQKQHIAGRLASGYGLGMFQPSLEMKESADFLLTPKAREAVRLRFVEGLGPKEAAKKAGCSISALYKRLERAEKAIRKTLKDEND
jgi:predicted DNA-binding protein (UPF0251 family)